MCRTYSILSLQYKTIAQVLQIATAYPDHWALSGYRHVQST